MIKAVRLLLACDLLVVVLSGCSCQEIKPEPVNTALTPETAVAATADDYGASDESDAPNVVAPLDPEIEKLIHDLVEITEPGFGYSLYLSGSEFLPYEETGHVSTLVLGAGRATRSDALRKIVENGASAVPTLLKHIDDKRTTKMEPLRGMMWMDFSDEYDFNDRTRKGKPEGVN